MGTPEIAAASPADSVESRRYNRIRRWLGIADFALGFVFLVALLATSWSASLRDLAYRAAFQHYSLAVFLYVFMLLLIAKLLGTALDYYGFRVEHIFQVSNQSLRSWLWDEAKSFLVGLVMATIVVELLYFIIRQFPEYWWVMTWATFMVLFIGLAQIAPVVLFP